MQKKVEKNQINRMALGFRLKKDLNKNAGAYVMGLLVLSFYIIFMYKPMAGAIIAFKDYNPRLGVAGSPWTSEFGFHHFIDFFTSAYFPRTMRNTIVISLSSLIFSFPLSILLALSINEVKNKAFKKTVQTISYMPYFISLVVVCSMITLFTSEKAFISTIVGWFGFEVTGNLLNYENAFVPIYVISGIWQNTGWNCIIYLAALAGIDMELYEAARIDGANRWKQTLHITLPGIAPTVILLLILAVGNIMNVGYEKVILLYNDLNRNTADVIASYVYRRGLEQADWSFGTAVGLFNSCINYLLVLIANKISRRVTGSGLW